MIKLSALIILTLISFGGCDQPTDELCPNAETYVMQNFTGLDACGWMLIQGDQRFEIINFDEFFDSFEEGNEVQVELIPRLDMASACMAGQISEIACKR